MSASVRILKEKRREFLETVRFLQDDKLREKGLIASNWREHQEDVNGYLLTDEWESEEDLKRYFRTDNFRVFLGALKTLCAEAEVKYGLVHRRGGAENSKEAESKRFEYYKTILSHWKI